jgi:tRNA 2-selenouridine synthase
MDFLEPASFLEKVKSTPVLDVRSPSEFSQGHIPGAINMPLFNDEERKITGTLYKHSGRYDSFLKGLEFAGPKLSGFVKLAHKVARHHTIALHCWRGGMRSQTVAWLLKTAGFQVTLLANGYKAYRRFVLESFSAPLQLLVLGGKTGSGKSLIIRELAQNGEQIIDLESLANHKGSAFGGIGHNGQPTNEQFENNLNAALSVLDPARPVWIEDESQGIGRVQIPVDLYLQMKDAAVVFIEICQKVRIHRLVSEYGEIDRKDLKRCVEQITKRLGGRNTKQALESLDRGDLNTSASILLSYYDKAYLRGLSKRNPGTIHNLVCRLDDPAKNAGKIIRVKDKILNTLRNQHN